MDAAAERAFRGFAAARLPALLRFAHLLTGDPTSAEDLVQTALARTALSWSRVRRQDDPEGYVRRTMLNLQSNVRRGRPWRESPTADPLDVLEPRSPADEYDDRDRMWQRPLRDQGLAVWPGADVLWISDATRGTLTCVDPGSARVRGARMFDATGLLVADAAGLYAVTGQALVQVAPSSVCGG